MPPNYKLHRCRTERFIDRAAVSTFGGVLILLALFFLLFGVIPAAFKGAP
jgi:hypothetical protein